MSHSKRCIVTGATDFKGLSDMTVVTKEISNKIANMSLLCSVMVVFMHCGRPTTICSFPWWFIKLTADGVCRIAVPFFFLISGYFLAGHISDGNWWLVENKKRINSLLLPYLIWNGLFVSWMILVAIVFDHLYLLPIGSSISVPNSPFVIFGLNPFKDPLLGPLWYIRTLIFLVLASPILIFLVKKIPIIIIVGSLILACIIFPDYPGWGGFRGVFLRHCFSPIGVAYFSLGIYLRTHEVRVGGVLPMIIAVVMSIVCISVTAYLGVVEGAIRFGVIEFSAPFIMYTIWKIMPLRNLPWHLTSYSFAIYVLHFFVLHALYKKRAIFFGPDYGPLFALLCAILIPIFATLILRKYLPGVAKFLFGGR